MPMTKNIYNYPEEIIIGNGNRNTIAHWENKVLVVELENSWKKKKKSVTGIFRM